jgi:malonyl CoA-acyl carrier protein transacylase
MMAVGRSASEAQAFFDEHALRTGEPKLVIACINSPKSVTISGDSAQIDHLGTCLSAEGLFARKLNERQHGVPFLDDEGCCATILRLHFGMRKGRSIPFVN